MRLELALDAAIAVLAGRQYGVIAFHQLLECGLSQSGVARRVRAGRLHPIHRGVYAVGHAGLSREGWWMAGVLACGDGAVLSHTSAAALWGMRELSDGAPTHVTVRSPGGRARRKGLILHRAPTLLTSQTTLRTRIPVTRPTRTLQDLRRILPADQYRTALRQAEYLRLPVAELKPDGTRSDLERLFLRLCRRHRLPKPEVNVRIAPFLADFLWRERRLIVETDSRRAHGGQAAFEDDRARDVMLKLRGYDVLRFTWLQVTEEPKLVAAAVRALLDA